VGALWGFVYRGARDLPVLQPNLPFFVYKVVFPILTARNLKNDAYGHGIGRHSEAEVIEMGIKDMRALSCFLGTIFYCFNRVTFTASFYVNNLIIEGTKLFFMGDKPTEVDCSMFGMIAQMVWNLPDSPFEQLLDGKIILIFKISIDLVLKKKNCFFSVGEFVNLKNYTMRMKETFWPDWDQCLAQTRT